MTALVVAAHGLRHPGFQRTIEAITLRVQARLPGTSVRLAYGGGHRPSMREVLAELGEPAVVVPLRLSSGRHVHELPAHAGRHPVTETLGPARLLTGVLQLRLVAAGARPGQPVVMVAAGSSEPAARGDTGRAARLLQESWGGPVRAAHLSGRGPRMSEVVAEYRSQGLAPAAVASYLLAPSPFHVKARGDARALGLTTVADVIGDHPYVAEVVIRRFRTTLARRFALSLA